MVLWGKMSDIFKIDEISKTIIKLINDENVEFDLKEAIDIPDVL